MKIQQITGNNTNFNGVPRMIVREHNNTVIGAKIYASLSKTQDILKGKAFDIFVTSKKGSSFEIFAQKREDYLSGKTPAFVQHFTKEEIHKIPLFAKEAIKKYEHKDASSKKQSILTKLINKIIK